MKENRIITSPLHTFYHQKSLVFYFRMQTGQLKLFLYVATPPSHLQCSQYYETFSVHDSCRRKLILAPSGGVGRCHRTVLTHVTELGWVRPGDISSELYGDWLWDENFKFCLIFTHFSRFSPFSGYIWWNNTLSSLENFSLNSILFFLVLMSHPDNGGFLKIAQKRDSISKKTSFCIMVINTDHQESWFLSVGHPLCALR